jgi:GH18 family chitinase
MSDISQGQSIRLVGYFPAGAIHAQNYHVTDIPAGVLSHVIYAFANVTAAGDCVSVNAGDDSVNFPQLLALKASCPGLLVLISVGGASHSTNFSAVSADAATRAQIAQSCVQFMTQNGFDGIDIDWEFPGAVDSGNFTALLEELRSQLDAQGDTDGRDYLLTIAAPAGPQNIVNLQLALIHPYLDWINLMTYDFSTASSRETNFVAPLFTHEGALNVNAAVNSYLGAGCRAIRSSWACALSAPAGRESRRRMTGSIRKTAAPRRGPGICRGPRQAAVSATRTSKTTTSPAIRAAGIGRRRSLGSIMPTPGL